ncbi:c(7)-type cytochrome triheme domain-containing protein [Desulfurivibrio sp. D14AmB]|uniref:c(7)-type cytochrome triheme domain-containing protein n=1 Tax=Desulfurivibrio sp. D14AmB TaxID=3374370 RepID=UPI00376EC1A3
MMKFTATVAALIALLALATTAGAVPPGQTVEYAGGGPGKVIFDGQFHADQGLNCNACHAEVFPMQRGATISMADHNDGKFCFDCHRVDGTAFPSSSCASSLNCDRCHKR